MSELERVCAWQECRKTFLPAMHNQIYHSDQCRNLATSERLKSRYREDMARTKGAKRVCKSTGCDTMLSRYNKSRICAKCEAKAEDNRTQDALRAIGL